MAGIDDLVQRNRGFAAALPLSVRNLPAPPSKRVAILTCMDARMHPEKFLRLEPGEAHVIRNAGGRASPDVIRSLIISSHLLGTREYMVIHHTDCGMLTHTNDEIRQTLAKNMGVDATGMDFLPFTDLEQSVRDDIRAIRESRFIPTDVTVRGFVYDVTTGRVLPVEDG